MTALALNFSSLLEFINRLQGKFIKAPEIAPASERKRGELQEAGNTIPLEVALNSRCTSDYNGRQNIFHWGLFDPRMVLLHEDIQHILDLVKIPRFTDGSLDIRYEENMVHFLMSDTSDELERSWLMIESGMQQQVLCLLCAAYGVGMVFKSLGDNGQKYSNTYHDNTRMKLDAMQASYAGSFWCESEPEGLRPWLKGNLPSPDRKGHASLTELVADIDSADTTNTKPADIKDISQILWAARGRTPHYYKSKPWGMTIPVSRGDQNITSIFLASSGQLYQYSNWQSGRPTHSLIKIADNGDVQKLQNLGAGNDQKCHIILARNEESGRGLWEIGYQLINIILQAKALGFSFVPVLADHNLRNKIMDREIKDPWAVVTIQSAALSLDV